MVFKSIIDKRIELVQDGETVYGEGDGGGRHRGHGTIFAASSNALAEVRASEDPTNLVSCSWLQRGDMV